MSQALIFRKLCCFLVVKHDVLWEATNSIILVVGKIMLLPTEFYYFWSRDAKQHWNECESHWDIYYKNSCGIFLSINSSGTLEDETFY